MGKGGWKFESLSKISLRIWVQDLSRARGAKKEIVGKVYWRVHLLPSTAFWYPLMVRKDSEGT